MTKKTRYFMAGSAAIVVAGLCTGLAAYYGGGFPALSASTGPTELAFVPADAAVVAYADVRAIMDSELRQRLKTVLPMPEKGQEEFHSETGIDIEHDIDYVVGAMATSAGGATPDKSGLVVARGRFDVVRLEGLAREHGGTVEDYRGKRLVTVRRQPGDHHDHRRHAGGRPLPHPATSMTIAFLEPGLVAVGESAAVKHAIDAQMRLTSITSNNEMMELVSDIERPTMRGRSAGSTCSPAYRAPRTDRRPGQRGEVVRRRGPHQRRAVGDLRAEARDNQAGREPSRCRSRRAGPRTPAGAERFAASVPSPVRAVDRQPARPSRSRSQCRPSCSTWPWPTRRAPRPESCTDDRNPPQRKAGGHEPPALLFPAAGHAFLRRAAPLCYL